MFPAMLTLTVKAEPHVFSLRLLTYTLVKGMERVIRLQAAVYFLKKMLVAESGAERSVMDEESDLEQMRCCQKLLRHQTEASCWGINGDSLLHILRTSDPFYLLFFFKMESVQSETLSPVHLKLISQSVDVNKTCPVITWAKLGDSLSAEVEQLVLSCVRRCVRSARVSLWFIMKGGSVLHVTGPTKFTSRDQMQCWFRTKAVCALRDRSMQTSFHLISTVPNREPRKRP